MKCNPYFSISMSIYYELTQRIVRVCMAVCLCEVNLVLKVKLCHYCTFVNRLYLLNKSVVSLCVGFFPTVKSGPYKINTRTPERVNM